MEHLLRCRKEYDSLATLADEGRLSEAVEASTQLQGLLDAAPPALTEAEVFAHLKVLLVQCNTFRGWLSICFSHLGCVQDREGPHRRTA